MATVGYARASTNGQSLDTQLEALSSCEKIFKEKISGANDDRPELQAVLEFVREGDFVQVTKLDRLASTLVIFLRYLSIFTAKTYHSTFSTSASIPPHPQASLCSL